MHSNPVKLAAIAAFGAAAFYKASTVLKVIYFPTWLIIAGWFLANRVNMPSLRLIHS